MLHKNTMHVKEIIKAGIRRKPKRYSPIGPWQLSLTVRWAKEALMYNLRTISLVPEKTTGSVPFCYLIHYRDISWPSQGLRCMLVIFRLSTYFLKVSISNSILASNFSCESRTNYIILRNGVFLYQKGKKVTGCSMNHQVCLFSVLAVE